MALFCLASSVRGSRLLPSGIVCALRRSCPSRGVWLESVKVIRLLDPQIFGDKFARAGASSLLCNAPNQGGAGYRVLCQRVTRGGADVVEVARLDVPGNCFGDIHAMFPKSRVSFLCIGHSFGSGAHYLIEWRAYGLTWSVSWWSDVVVGPSLDGAVLEYVREVSK